ncbi:hypothetical protein SLE2022_368040 [Rubroshorea leprosula]
MSYFSCRRNIVMSMLLVLVFFLFLHGSMAEDENGLFKSWSKEEMLQMAGYGDEKLSTVLVTGSVVCEACLQGESQLRSWPISGALVGVNCNTGHKGKPGVAQAVTDEYGDFLIDLPSHLHAIPNLHKTCCIRVIRVPKNTHCRPSHVRKHVGLKFSSVGNGIRTYTSGKIRFQHFASKPSPACMKEANRVYGK